MVQALMRSQMVESSHRQKFPQSEEDSHHGREDEIKNRGREQSPSQETSQERRTPNSLTYSPKRRQSPSSSHDSSRSGRSIHGRFHRSRSKRSSTPPQR